MDIVAKGPADIERAYESYYSRMAEHFIEQLGTTHIDLILEAGCGRGQLTVPLLRRLPKEVRMMAVDSSTGPYAGWLDDLVSKLRTAGLESRVQILEADARRMGEVEDKSVDVVVSNELLCDLIPEAQLEMAMREFFRILRPGGTMVHGEWSSYTENSSQSFLVKHWPTWTPDQLHFMMGKTGFRNFSVTYFDTTIRFGHRAALEELRSWGAPRGFFRQNERWVRRYGIRLPFEHVIRCEKAS